jgi:hypothetical protein
MALCGGAVRAWAASAATTTTLAITSGGSAVSTVNSGSVVTLTATVTSGGTPVTVGQVDFCDATATYCTDIHLLSTAQLTKSGKASMKFRPGVGSHGYKAVFAGTPNGTSNYSGSTSSTVTLTVTEAIPTTTSIAVSGIVGNYSLTATVTGSGSAVSPTGSVSILDTSNGNALLETAALKTGTNAVSWTNNTGAPTGVYPDSIATGDFNGDGIPDLAVANVGCGGTFCYGTVSILLGNGDGTFTATASPATGVEPISIAVGDFNGDGIADLAVVNCSGNLTQGTVSVLLGNGDGTFTAAASPTVGDLPQSIAVGDFNGDGIPDLAVVNMCGSGPNCAAVGSIGTVSILLGKGDGTFTLKSSLTTGVDPYFVAVGDFNGDGIPDLAVANNCGTDPTCKSAGTVSILLGNGDGTFTAKASPATGNGPLSIAVGDFNRDGKLDLAVANGSSNSISILLGNGDGTFTAAASAAAGYGKFVAIGDFNQDGVTDLAVAIGGGSTVTVLLGNGDGTFNLAASPVVGYTPESLAVGDFNGDGIPDLAVAIGSSGSTIRLLLTQLTQVATAIATRISPVGTGTHLIVASYPGDSSYNSSTSGTAALTAQQGTPTVTVTPSSSSITTAQPLSVTVAVNGGSGNPTPTGTVMLTSNGYSSTPTALSSGSATINVPAGSLATGTDTLTANYSGDGNYIANTGTTSVTVTVPPPSFTVSGTSVTVLPGAATGNTSTITVTPSGGFAGSVVLTAAVTSSPTGAQYPPTFSFGSTSPVSITGTSAGTATLTITTTAATNAALVLPKHNGVPWYAAGGAALAGILLFCIPARRRSWQTMLGMLVLLVALTGGVLACGGGGSGGGGGGGGTSNPGTTAGTYTVTVTGTSGTTTATGTVALTVQ